MTSTRIFAASIVLGLLVLGAPGAVASPEDPPSPSPCYGPATGEQTVPLARRTSVAVDSQGIGPGKDPLACTTVVITSPSFPGFACVQPGGPYTVFRLGPVEWQTYCGDGGSTRSEANPPCHGFFYMEKRVQPHRDVWVNVGTNLQTDCIIVDARVLQFLCHAESSHPKTADCRVVRSASAAPGEPGEDPDSYTGGVTVCFDASPTLRIPSYCKEILEWTCLGGPMSQRTTYEAWPARIIHDDCVPGPYPGPAL
ncbi:MAG: hypothetical protein ACPGQL_00860 [Thermoplasmatota archaeon]